MLLALTLLPLLLAVGLFLAAEGLTRPQKIREQAGFTLEPAAAGLLRERLSLPRSVWLQGTGILLCLSGCAPLLLTDGSPREEAGLAATLLLLGAGVLLPSPGGEPDRSLQTPAPAKRTVPPAFSLPDRSAGKHLLAGCRRALSVERPFHRVLGHQLADLAGGGHSVRHSGTGRGTAGSLAEVIPGRLPKSSPGLSAKREKTHRRSVRFPPKVV